jgi:hypothetical protein
VAGAAALATIVLAVGIEGLQDFVGRERSLSDVWLSLAGTGLALAQRFPVASGSSGRRTGQLTVSGVIMGMALWPLGLALFDESRARRDFPTLSGFTSKLELSRWEGGARVSWVAPEPGEHDGAMAVETAPGRNGLHSRYFPRDWSGYRRLSMRVRNNGTQLALICRISDLEHSLRTPHDPADHFEARFEVDGGWQELSIDLPAAAASLSDRRMDLEQMNSLTCNVHPREQAASLVLDWVTLLP